MAAFFPELYPDELLYSACARYDDLLAYEGAASTCRDLFGADRITVSVDLPSGLELMYHSLPRNHSLEIDRLINQHTLYRLYCAFAPSGRAAILRNDMIKRTGAAHERSGSLASKLRTVYFRFCTECAKKDREIWGETYWHRLHNSPGVEVCPTHRIFLESSSVRTTHRPRSSSFCVAERVIELREPRTVSSSEEVFVTLAMGIDWLLNQELLSSTPEITRYRYQRLLFEKNLATHTGTVYNARLERAFLDFYSPQLLRRLACEFKYKSTWLRRIVQKAKRNSHQPPIYHLLLMNFLGCPVSRFFALPETPLRVFGNGPWPCLNRAAEHYRMPVVETCQIKVSCGRPKRPLGTFICNCGFIYCRFGPDGEPNARYRFHRTKSYGEIWYTRLRTLRFEKGLSSKKIASELGCWPQAVRREIGKLINSENLRLPGKKKNISERIKDCRSEWSRAFKKHPAASRTDLRQLVGQAVYTCLLYNDRKWFEKNSPTRRTPRPSPFINWRRRDTELASQAKDAASEILNRPGRPVRVSATAIAATLGILAIVHQRPQLLPLTVETIAQLSESTRDFIIRRVRRAVDEYRVQGVSFTRSQLQASARVSNELWRDPQLKTIIYEIAGLS